MIRYALTCKAGHGFESWFASAEAYAALAGTGQLACPVCGLRQIEKALMAPSVRPARTAESAAEERPKLGLPATELETALAELRRQVEANSEYVGMNFVAEARAIHDGAAPERSIYGEARPDEAKRLIEDGVPVAPLPFRPARKTN
ncbi:DUF1178 family protein [Rhodobacter sp. Har01]|uniref:DUF1178 family protein n=1 Tax=Rhodobacter sp. Har01 TaxID=2883999 RepID=UPI001D07E2FA|nr:DUF1178 family protein [Rhodobacter sp. Har01]MCB6178839.1 DUF1178 family protein [Rhodobacter sp. Har01]